MGNAARGYPSGGYRAGSSGYGGFQKPGTGGHKPPAPANDNTRPLSPANDNYPGSPRTPWDKLPKNPRPSFGWPSPRLGIDVLGDVSRFWELYKNEYSVNGYNMQGWNVQCYNTGGGAPTSYGDYCGLSFLLEPMGFVLPPVQPADTTMHFTEIIGPWGPDPSFQFMKTRSTYNRPSPGPVPEPTTEAWGIPTNAPQSALDAQVQLGKAELPGQEPDPRSDRGYSRTGAYASNYPSYRVNPGRAWDRGFADVPGLSFTYDNLSGPSRAPAVRPGTAGTARPPTGDRVKEKKMILTPGGSGAFGDAARRIMNIFTESTDVLDALWQALPESIRGKRNKRLTKKAEDVWNNLDAIDWTDALLNIAGNHLEDKVIGGLSSNASKAYGRSQNRFGSAGRSVGITTGPAI